MVTIKDLDIPKEFLRKKKIPLYKAFILKDGEEMNVDTDIDILSFTYEAAVQYMLNSMTMEEIDNLKGNYINFAIFTIDKSELTNKNLVLKEDAIYKDGSISITLSNKIYKVDVDDKHVDEIEVDTNPKNEIKVMKNIALS